MAEHKLISGPSKDTKLTSTSLLDFSFTERCYSAELYERMYRKLYHKKYHKDIILNEAITAFQP